MHTARADPEGATHRVNSRVGSASWCATREQRPRRRRHRRDVRTVHRERARDRPLGARRRRPLGGRVRRRVDDTGMGRLHLPQHRLGDAQRRRPHAPTGAAEFIDVDVERARADGVRYVLVAVIFFTGQPFKNFSAHAGAMTRETRSGQRLERVRRSLLAGVGTRPCNGAENEPSFEPREAAAGHAAERRRPGRATRAGRWKKTREERYQPRTRGCPGRPLTAVQQLLRETG